MAGAMKALEEILATSGILLDDQTARTSMAADLAVRHRATADQLEVVMAYLFDVRGGTPATAENYLLECLSHGEWGRLLEVAEKSEARFRAGEREPGQTDREQDKEWRETQTYKEQEVSLKLYQMLYHNEASADRAMDIAQRELKKKLDDEQLRDLITKGADMADAPSPALSTHLLLGGRRRELTLWQIWWRQGQKPLKRPKNQRVVDKILKEAQDLDLLPQQPPQMEGKPWSVLPKT